MHYNNQNIRAATDMKYWLTLKEQLQKKMDAFKKSETVPEMAEMLEAIDAICAYRKFYAAEIKVREKKRLEGGNVMPGMIFEEA